MSWFWMILLVTILFAFSDLIDKFLTEKKFKNIFAFAVSNTLLGLIFILPLCFLVDFSGFSSWPLFLALASGPIYSLMWILFWKALASSEASRAIAVFNAMPIFNALLAAQFLKESITGIKWLAIFLIALGAALASWEKKRSNGFNLAYLLMVLSAFLAAVGNVVSKLATSHINPLTVYPLSYFGALPFYLLFLSQKKVRTEIKLNFKDKKVFAILLIRNLIVFVAVCLFYLAIAQGPISLIMAIQGTGPVFVFILATLASLFIPQYLKEEITAAVLRLKALAIILVVSGIVLISQ